MASPTIWPGGLNLTGTVFSGGPSLAQLAPYYTSGAIQFLDTISGNNANAGSEPELPVATLAQAITNSAANGIILIGTGSTEDLAASQAVNIAGLKVIGCGSGSTAPRYTCTGAVDMWAVSAAGVRIRNIYFPVSTAASTSRIAITAASCSVRDCYFECGASDTTRSLRIHTGANNTIVRGCAFAALASRPAVGLEVTAAVTDTTLESLTFSGGSYGWSDYALKFSAAATRIWFESVAMTNRSDCGITVTATSYDLFGLTNDGTSRVVLTA